MYFFNKIMANFNRKPNYDEDEYPDKSVEINKPEEENPRE